MSTSAPSAAPKKRKPRTVQVVEEANVARKVALVGFTKSREDAPYDDPEWTVAGCNNLHRQPGMEELWSKCDVWYDLHDLDTIRQDPVHVEWLQAGHMPCFVTHPQPDWPQALPFPHQEILDWVKGHGLAGERYFTNSVSWMFAHAHMLLERAGFDQGRGGEIGAWGIDMAVDTEYESQRPSCEYFLGFAEGRGIKVTVSDRSDLLKCASLYGLEDSSPIVHKMRDREKELVGQIATIHQRRAEIDHEAQQLHTQEAHIYGALMDTRYYLGRWFQPVGTRQGGDDPYSTSPTEAQPVEGQSG